MGLCGLTIAKSSVRRHATAVSHSCCVWACADWPLSQCAGTPQCSHTAAAYARPVTPLLSHVTGGWALAKTVRRLCRAAAYQLHIKAQSCVASAAAPACMRNSLWRVLLSQKSHSTQEAHGAGQQPALVRYYPWYSYNWDFWNRLTNVTTCRRLIVLKCSSSSVQCRVQRECVYMALGSERP
jgi:hypothetical protein